MGEKAEALERQNRQLLASHTAMRDNLDRMQMELDGLLLVNPWMAEAIVQLRTSQVHNWDNPIVIDNDSSDEGTIAEAPEVPEQFHLVLIKEEVIEDSKEEDSDDEVWEITQKEFEDKVVNTWGKSPKL